MAKLSTYATRRVYLRVSNHEPEVGCVVGRGGGGLPRPLTRNKGPWTFRLKVAWIMWSIWECIQHIAFRLRECFVE